MLLGIYAMPWLLCLPWATSGISMFGVEIVCFVCYGLGKKRKEIECVEYKWSTYPFLCRAHKYNSILLMHLDAVSSSLVGVSERYGGAQRVQLGWGVAECLLTPPRTQLQLRSVHHINAALPAAILRASAL